MTLPLSIMLGDPDLGPCMQSIIDYTLLEAVCKQCEIAQSKLLDPSTTLKKIVPMMGGLDDWQVGFSLRVMSERPNSLIQTKPEGHDDMRVRLSQRGIAVIAGIRQEAKARQERFQEMVGRRWPELQRFLGNLCDRPESFAALIRRDIRRAVQSDLGPTLKAIANFVGKLGEIEEDKLAGFGQPSLRACGELKTRLERQSQSEKTERAQLEQCGQDVDTLVSYVTDAAQSEVSDYLMSRHYPSLMSALAKSSKRQHRQVVVCDLSVVIAMLSTCDRLNAPVKDCLLAAKKCGIGGPDSVIAMFAFPFGFYEALRQQLSRAGARYQQLRIAWQPEYRDNVPTEAEALEPLEKLAEYSLFREFAFGDYGSFEGFADHVLASYRGIAGEHTVVAKQVRMPGLEKYHEYIGEVVSRTSEETRFTRCRLWTYDERLRSIIPDAVHGNILHAFLAPEWPMRIEQQEKELAALRGLGWWRSGLVGSQMAQLRRDVTKELLAAIDKKVKRH